MSSPARHLQHEEPSFDDLMKALTDNFNILADEVQLLSDRKTILEHKLRFAHEQCTYSRIFLMHQHLTIIYDEQP